MVELETEAPAWRRMLSASCFSLHPQQARPSLASQWSFVVWLISATDRPSNIVSRSAWILWQTGFVPDGWSDRRDALPQGCVLRDYTIQAVLGHGGFGIVYKASHNELDQVVAIKEYLPSELAVREGATVRAKSADCETYFADGLRRFREEAKALIDFQRHPSTVACSEFFRANGTAYLVMEYVDGQPLSQVLREREATGEPFTESDLLSIAVPLAEGLAHIHRAGVVHRDIKPANILVRRADQQPVLIDFGAAKQAVAEHSRSLAPYTEGYAALEHVADGRLGPWTDLYGYGAVLWRMVAGGNRPWEPPNPVKVEQRLHAVVSGTEDPMPSASELGEGRFPSQLLEIIDGCLRLRETERVQGSHELLEALRKVSEPPPAVVAGSTRPLAERTGAKRQERGSGEMRAGSVPRAGWRRGRGIANPWIGDWDALGDIRGPGIAKAVRAYIERYKQVPAARVWVAKAERLAVSEWRAAIPMRREVGKPWVNALGMEFVWIPAGNFLMGSTLDPPLISDHKHVVRISEGFWIGKYEVTQGEWEAVMGTNPSRFSNRGPWYPVENVSWHDAQAFIRRLNESESGSRYGHRLPRFIRRLNGGGHVYRLPTDAEWEYAARAGTFGIRYGELDEIAWYSDNSGKSTHPIGQKQANAWGLHDMLGNVSEWVDGGWPGRFTAVQRGGGWDSLAKWVGSTHRGHLPSYFRSDGFGFRLVMAG